MDRAQLFKKSRAHKIIINDTAKLKNLVSIFEIFIKDETPSNFSKYLTLLGRDPLDYQFPVHNKSESCQRMIYILLNRNEIIEALHIFVYLIHNYNIHSSFVWRVGFHILSFIGDQRSMNKFFTAMLASNSWDPSNMVYEYFLYLFEKKDYSLLKDIYYTSYPKIYHIKRYKREPEMEKIHHLIKLLVALSFYCKWKESLLEGHEDESSLIQAELDFTELEIAIKKNIVVDSFLLNYIDLLTYLSKFEKALEILQLYYTTMKNHCNAVFYLLNFLIVNEQCLQGISKKYISEIREDFINRQLMISPKDDRFILNEFRTHVEELDKEGEHEKIIKLLFKFLSNPEWTSIEWPWKYLLNSVQVLTVSNRSVQEQWDYVGRMWKRLIFKTPSNPSMTCLANILDYFE